MRIIALALVALGLYCVPLPAPAPPAGPSFSAAGGFLTRLDGAGRFELKFLRSAVSNERFGHAFVDFDNSLANWPAR